MHYIMHGLPAPRTEPKPRTSHSCRCA